MSYKLYAVIRTGKAEDGDKEIFLRQTPAYIARMILVNPDGGIGELRGRDATRALRAYCEWVQLGGDGYRGEIDDFHIKNIRSHLTNPNLVVGMT